MPSDPYKAVELLLSGGGGDWNPMDLHRLRRALVGEYSGPHRAAAIARVDVLLGRHA